MRSWGTFCFVGEGGQLALDVSADLLRRQVTLVGSWTFFKRGQVKCAEFVADRGVDVERLFRAPLEIVDQWSRAYSISEVEHPHATVYLPRVDRILVSSQSGKLRSMQPPMR